MTMLFEVKSTTDSGNVLGKSEKNFYHSQGGKAARQCLTHMSRLNDELSLGFDCADRDQRYLQQSWVKLCVVFPNFDGCDQDKQEFLTRVENVFGPGSSNIAFLTKADVELFQAHLEALLPPPALPGLNVTETAGNARKYFQMATWCLFHTFGMILSHRSKVIDKEHSTYIASGVGSGHGDPAAQQTQIALLTPLQMYILANQRHPEKPALILGSAGTGKTFLLVGKIKLLREKDLINEQAKALVIVHADQCGLYAQLKAKLDPFGPAVVIRSVDRNGRKKKPKVLLDFLKTSNSMQGVKYVFVDQLEDFVERSTDVLAELAAFNEYRRQNPQIQLLWFLWNGKAGFRHDVTHLPDIVRDVTESIYGTGTC